MSRPLSSYPSSATSSPRRRLSFSGDGKELEEKAQSQPQPRRGTRIMSSEEQARLLEQIQQQAQQVTPVQLVQLAQHPDYSGAITDVNTQLQQAGIEFAALAEAMLETGTILAGGSTLKAALNWIHSSNPEQAQAQRLPHGNWESDFDFWVLDDPDRYYDPFQVLYPVFKAAGYKHLQRVNTSESQYDRLKHWVKRIHLLRHESDLNQYGQANRNTPPTHPPVQVMVLNQTHYVQQLGHFVPTTTLGVVQSFDLTICQVIYDADRLYALQPITREMMISEGAKHQTPFEWIRTVSRVNKYVQRGFTADWLDIAANVLSALERLYSSPHRYVYSRYVYYNQIVGVLFKMDEETRNTPLRFVLILNSSTTERREVTGDEQYRGNLRPDLRQYDRAFTVEALVTDEDGQTRTLDAALAGTAPTEAGNFSPRMAFQPMPEFTPAQDQHELVPQPEPLARAESGQDVEALARRPGSPESRSFTVDQFQYPADWQNVPSTINTGMDQYTNILNTAQCYDLLESYDIQFSQYLREDPTDNIILIAPPPPNSPPDTLGTNATCARRSEFARILTDLSAIALPCVGQGGTTFPPDASARFVRLPPYNIFVPEIEVRTIANEGHIMVAPKIYQAEPTNLIIPVTASADAILNLRYVSADHCQAGTEKTIYHLRPVLSDELFGYSAQEFQAEENKRREECKEEWTPGNYYAQYLGECGIGEQYNLGNVEAFEEPYGETLLNLSESEFKRRNREIERNCRNERGQIVPGDYRTRRMSQCVSPAHMQNLTQDEYNVLENQVRQSCIDSATDYDHGDFSHRLLGHCVSTGEAYELGQVAALRTEEEERELEEQKQLERERQAARAPFLASERKIYDDCMARYENYVPGIINERPGQCLDDAILNEMTPEEFRNLNNEIQQTCLTYGHGFAPGVPGVYNIFAPGHSIVGGCIDLREGEDVPTYAPENSLADSLEDRSIRIGGRNRTRGLGPPVTEAVASRMFPQGIPDVEGPNNFSSYE